MDTLVYRNPWGTREPVLMLYDTPEGHFFGKVIGRHPALIRFHSTDFQPMRDEKNFSIRLTELLPDGRITHSLIFAQTQSEVKLTATDRLLCVSALGDRR